MILLLNFLQYNFGSAYDIDFKPTSGFELIDENWKVENWIKMNGDKERFNGCKAFQKVLNGEFIDLIKYLNFINLLPWYFSDS